MAALVLLLPQEEREGESLVRNERQRVAGDVPHEHEIGVVTEPLKRLEAVTPIDREQEVILLPRLDVDGGLDVDGVSSIALRA